MVPHSRGIHLTAAVTGVTWDPEMAIAWFTSRNPPTYASGLMVSPPTNRIVRSRYSESPAPRPFPSNSTRALKHVSLTSVIAGDRYLKSYADLAHPAVRQSAEAVDKHSDRDAFDRVQVGRRAPGDRIFIGLKNNLAG